RPACQWPSRKLPLCFLLPSALRSSAEDLACQAQQDDPEQSSSSRTPLGSAQTPRLAPLASPRKCLAKMKTISCTRCAALSARLPQNLHRLKQGVLRGRFANLEHPGNFRVPEAFHFVQQKNIALMSRQLRERALQSHAERRVRARCARLSPRRFFRIVICRYFF